MALKRTTVFGGRVTAEVVDRAVPDGVAVEVAEQAAAEAADGAG